MEEVKSSYQKELRDYEIDIDKRRKGLANLHIGEEKNKGFRKNHDSNGGDGEGDGAGAVGSTSSSLTHSSERSLDRSPCSSAGSLARVACSASASCPSVDLLIAEAEA